MKWRGRITLETIYSGLSKSNFKDHYGDAATEQCMGMIAEINEFSVSAEMSWVMGQTGRQPIRQVLRCSAMKSSVDNDRQFELDALACSEPVKTDESICNTLRATESEDRP